MTPLSSDASFCAVYMEPEVAQTSTVAGEGREKAERVAEMALQSATSTQQQLHKGMDEARQGAGGPQAGVRSACDGARWGGLRQADGAVLRAGWLTWGEGGANWPH